MNGAWQTLAGMRQVGRFHRAGAGGLVAAMSAATLLVPTSVVPPAQAAAADRSRTADSLPSVSSGHRPGPDILYADPPRAPQLENAPGSVWREKPLLVSGASAYRGGEFLYQGWLFDDHGAAGARDPGDPFTGAFLFAAKAGTLTYPKHQALASNAADLVEFRTRAVSSGTAFRVTLNTLIDPARTAFTVAIGDSAETRPWPAGAGVRSPAQMFLTVHGQTAELVDAKTGAALAPAPSGRVDLERRQVEVVVPRSAWDPGTMAVRLAAGAGVWDGAAGRYASPGPTATPTTPGGAAPSQAALFDLAFRPQEPLPDPGVPPGRTLGDSAVLQQVRDNCWWRECAQAAALRAGDVSAFSAVVDFGKLRRRQTDDSQVRTTGSIDRIFASHFSNGQGLNWEEACGRFPKTCTGLFGGQLAPYNVYVPDRPVPADGWGLTHLLHASTANYNQYMGSRHQAQFGERGTGSLTLTSSARDARGDYIDLAEADVFEAWADLARHYPLDDSYTAISGYSMGAGGTYKMAERWPDLFARGMGAAAVPRDGLEGQSIASLRNVPMMTWIGDADGTSPQDQQKSIEDLTRYGYRFAFAQFPTADHLTLAGNDEYGVAAAFLGEHRVDRNPAHVTFVVDPRNDSARAGLVADHAYWLADLRAVGGGEDPRGTVDARSLAFSSGQPVVSGPRRSIAVLTGGSHGPLPYREVAQEWPSTPDAPAEDRLVASFQGLTSATLDVTRARLTCGAAIELTTNRPLTLAIPACDRTLAVPAGRFVLDLDARDARASAESSTPSDVRPSRLPATGLPMAPWLALAAFACALSLGLRRMNGTS